jgi:heat shock protein HtpX
MYEAISANKWKSAILVSLFLVVILGLGFGVGAIWGMERAFIGLILAMIIAVIMALTSYYKSDKIALSMAGARQVTREDYPYYVNTVEGLSLAAGIPVPRTFIIETPAMNAFATGRDPEHAAVAVTTGLLESLNRLELEGVIAHEMSHVKNYDIRLMSMVVVLVGVIVIFSEVVIRMLFWGGIGGGRNRDSGGGGGGDGGAIWVVLAIAGIVLLILAPIFAQMLQLAVSRKREYLADANGALLTRYPEGLAGALEKLSTEAKPFPRASDATAHLFIVQPFKKEAKASKMHKSKIWDTHPPIPERIRRLRAMGSMDGMYTQAQMEAKGQ